MPTDTLRRAPLATRFVPRGAPQCPLPPSYVNSEPAGPLADRFPRITSRRRIRGSAPSRVLVCRSRRVPGRVACCGAGGGTSRSKNDRRHPSRRRQRNHHPTQHSCQWSGPRSVTATLRSSFRTSCSTTSVDAIVSGGHGSHTGPVFPEVGPGQNGKWGDIIPPFDYDNGQQHFDGIELARRISRPRRWLRRS